MNFRKIATAAILVMFCSFAASAQEEERINCKPVEIHNLVCGIAFGTGCGLMGLGTVLGLLTYPGITPISAPACLTFGTVSVINFVKYKKHCDQCRGVSLNIGPTKAELSLNF